MALVDARNLLRRELATRLTQERVHEQPTTHADAAMNAPHRKLDTGLLERLAPRQHVLVDAVY